MKKKAEPFEDKGGYRKVDNAIRPEYCELFLRTFEAMVRPNLNRILHEMPTDARAMYDYKNKYDAAPIPWKSRSVFMDYSDIAGTKKDIPKLAPQRNAFYKEMASTGIPQLFRSESWNHWFLNACGADAADFEELNEKIQFSRYEHGDNIGLHNDYYGTRKEPTWFIDAHISFVNDWVKHQYMLFGEKTLDQSVDVTKNGSIGLYKLPLWHFVTPLIGKTGHEEKAARWLIILDRYYNR